MTFRVRAAAIIFNARGELLLVFHRSPITGDEWWTLPGGGLEDNENALEALVREVKEECGVECKPGRLVYVREFLESTEKGVHHVELFFTAEVDTYDIVTGFDPEFAEQYIIESRFLSKKEIVSSNTKVYPEILNDRFWNDLRTGFIGHDVYLGIKQMI
ncbi:NUDIX hydrolase [Desulfosporosinus sp. PR]|uniref:NUDIX hydrolase n=1 Tax=Candidatus Desulfosporosinus nitrosoreducens TaxID=3401928 RepID=UPI0027F8E0B2|nr:NUDIX hydrolase [Desulfosporosinus sp. PR]MDQ7096666.1 NUDIX hydrolase [Desulfosporosinus sp. PR]